MAIIMACDGCETTATYPMVFEEMGVVLKRQYCEACKGEVEQYLRARNELHTDLSEKWYAGLEELDQAFFKEHPRGTLPDRT